MILGLKIPKVEITKAKIRKQDYIKLRFSTAEKVINKMKRQL